MKKRLKLKLLSRHESDPEREATEIDSENASAGKSATRPSRARKNCVSGLTPNGAPTVLITGGARGLGLILAEAYAERGYNVAICSRTESDLAIASERLRAIETSKIVQSYRCDVANSAAVNRMVGKVTREIGGIDLLVNCAGVILSSPLIETGRRDFQDAIGANLYGMIHLTLAVTPGMIERGGGQILNIASVGGVFPVPHLAAYSASKFGAVGFSTASSIELAEHGIQVTTALPSLMRTGSFLHARFKGDTAREMKLFAMISTYPLVSLSAERVAKRLLKAVDRREAFVVVGLSAKLARLAFALAPNWSIRALSFATRFLPHGEDVPHPQAESVPGHEVQAKTGDHSQSKLGDRAAEKWNELGTDRNGLRRGIDESVDGAALTESETAVR